MDKICPFLAARGDKPVEESKCLGSKCALYQMVYTTEGLNAGFHCAIALIPVCRNGELVV